MSVNDDEKKPGKRGFSGLNSLVSEVDQKALESSSVRKKLSAPSPGVQKPLRDSPQPNRSSEERRLPANPRSGKPASTSSTKKWLFGVACLVGIIWWINESSVGPTSPSGGYQTSPRPTVASPSTLSTPSRPAEVRPPVGDNNVLSVTQLHYCLAEDIRLEGARSSVNNYDGAAVDRFNAMISDYNIRCGSFRYRAGSLERARRAVEAFRAQYVSEGRNRF